jgi:Flp pilus assembly protein TadG
MELALIMTVLSVVVLGAIDFGRIAYMAMALTNAARQGAMVGSQTAATSTQFSTMQLAAQSSASADIGTISAVATRSCECNVGGTLTVMGTCTSACAGAVQIRVTVTTSKTFNTITRFPGLNNSVSLTRRAIMRAQ